MDQELYYGLLQTLANGEVLKAHLEELEKEVEKTISNYTYQGTKLFRKPDKNHTEPREVIPKHRKIKTLQ